VLDSSLELNIELWMASNELRGVEYSKAEGVLVLPQHGTVWFSYSLIASKS